MSKKSKEKTWKDYPRLRDKVAIVGFHEATRDAAPYLDASYEIWGCNEEYRFDWMKREDRHFQMHPRWDFSRSNNMNDPNHFLWLQNKKGQCNLCKGSGKVMGKDKTLSEVCPFCENGTYIPPKDRRNMPIYMQKVHKDIPNSIALPMKEMTEEFLPSNHYYTSSPAYMLSLAMLMGYKKIELYGFDMGTKTEYHYQRANFEYWIGIAHGRGIEVTLPGSHILTGELYGYQNMKTGYRQQMEMREFELNKQFNNHKLTALKAESRLDLLKELKDNKDKKTLEELYKESLHTLQYSEGLMNIVNGAREEVKNLTNLYDSYFTVGTTNDGDGLEQEAYSQNENHVAAVYKKEEKNA